MLGEQDFPRLMRQLRRQQRLSFRKLAKIVHYSHTYLWDIESGAKPPTPHIAEALDAALDANGQLERLAGNARDDWETEPSPVVPPLLTNSDVHHMDTRPAASAGSVSPRRSTLGSASRRAQAATVLYDVFVRSRPPLTRLGTDRYSQRIRQATGLTPFRAEATMQGRIPVTECQSVTRQPAPSDIATLLLLTPGESVICRENRYFADGEPVQLGQTYIPLHIAGTSAIASKKNLGAGGLFARFEDLGHRITHIREQVTTRFPTRDEALALKLQPGVPVIVVLHAAHDDNGTPFEVTRFVMRSDLMAIQYAMTLGD
ncbi:UTRA domain-containing protein [Plantactinospora endophytica]|uniref:HTH cro/C1-type domain-containing protein n=1 Tax=Plantactinospora endophytica TaxID=673535 RepID=A0ABQ4DSR1_9ACTN|nr:UTRA domain-containing protein [Plantactinospora endophytica]GIG85111.1 hypothetical protein Pen02_00470 [Plantactinospora endophytica]